MVSLRSQRMIFSSALALAPALAAASLVNACGLKANTGSEVFLSAKVDSIQVDPEKKKAALFLSVTGTEGAKFNAGVAASNAVRSCDRIDDNLILKGRRAPDTMKFDLTLTPEGAPADNRLVCVWSVDADGKASDGAMMLNTGIFITTAPPTATQTRPAEQAAAPKAPSQDSQAMRVPQAAPSQADTQPSRADASQDTGPARASTVAPQIALYAASLGAWNVRSACNAITESTFSRETFSFFATRYSYQSTFFVDAACKTPLYSFLESGAVTARDTSLEFKVDSLKEAYFQQDYITPRNLKKSCGIDSWKVGGYVETVRQDCSAGYGRMTGETSHGILGQDVSGVFLSLNARPFVHQKTVPNPALFPYEYRLVRAP